jgi:hypothetical protein
MTEFFVAVFRDRLTSNASNIGALSVNSKLTHFRRCYLSSLPASELEMKVEDIFGLMIGNQVSLFGAKNGIATPRVASTSIDRSGAAADLATLCKELGAVTILKRYGVLERLEAQ